MKPSVRPQVFWLVALLLGVGLAAFLASRIQRSASPTANLSPPETHRTNLVLQASHWLLPGTTNAFTGLLLDTYEDGARKSLSMVSNGVLEGVSRGWHTNGQQQIEEHFVAGVSHGLRTKWHPNGQKLSEVNILVGKLEGTFRRWDDQGALTEEIEMKDGQPDGISRSYFPSGFLKAEVELHMGKVVSRKSWNDQEYRTPALLEAGAFSTNRRRDRVGGTKKQAVSALDGISASAPPCHRICTEPLSRRDILRIAQRFNVGEFRLNSH